MPAKVSGPGEEGQERLQDSAGRHGIPPDGDYQPGSQLPEEPRGAECGAAGSRARLMDCVGLAGLGVWKERGRLPSQAAEELGVLSGKAAAGPASGAGEARGSCPPTGPILAPGAPAPKPSGNRCLAAYSQRVWAGVRRRTVR